MTRNEALKLMEKHLTNVNLRKHCLAAEAVMRGLAAHFGVDQELWGLTGLLHDIDYEETKDDPTRHSLVGAEMLERLGLPVEVTTAVKVHNDRHDIPRITLLDRAMYATDPVTGLIVAGGLIRPEKKLAVLDVPFLINRFNEKSFARGARREAILACSELDLSLEEFLGISLEAMQSIAGELGL